MAKRCWMCGVIFILAFGGIPRHAVADEPNTRAIESLFDEIMPIDGPARPPFQLARFDATTAPEGTDADTALEKLAASAAERQTRLLAAWKDVGYVALDGSTAEIAAKHAILRYAFGDTSVDAAAESATNLPPDDRLRWCKLLLADCAFDEAVCELIRLAELNVIRAPEPAGDAFARSDSARISVDRQTLAILVVHHAEREVLAKKSQLWPLELNLAAWLDERAKGADGAMIEALRKTLVAPTLDDQETPVVEEFSLSEPADTEPDETLDIGFDDPARDAFDTLGASDLRADSTKITHLSHAQRFLQTEGSELLLFQPVRSWNTPNAAKIAIHASAGGPIRFRLYRFDAMAQLRAATAAQLAAREPLHEWRQAWRELADNNARPASDYEFEIEGLAEGHYILVATARGLPTAAACSFAVNDVALYLRVGQNAGAVVAVARTDGSPKRGVPIQITVVGKPKPPGDKGISNLSPRDAAFRAGFLGEALNVKSIAEEEDPQTRLRRAAAFLDQQAAHRAGAAERAKLPDFQQTLLVETGETGVARFPLDLVRPTYAYRIEAVRQADESDAALASTASVDIDAFVSQDETKAVVWLAQPVHRPGDTVSFQGIVRQFNGIRVADHDAATKQTCRVVVQRGSDEPLWQGECPVSEAGTFAGSFAIRETAKLGGYRFEVDGAKCYPSAPLFVAEFRTSAFRVAIDGAETFKAGEELDATVTVTYHTGKAVVGGEVEVLLDLGDVPISKTLVTDAQGRARLRTAVPESADRTLHFIATVTDASGYHYAASKIFRVAERPFHVASKTIDEPSEHAESIAYRIDAKDLAGKPLSGTTVVVDGIETTIKTDDEGAATVYVPWALFRDHKEVGLTVISGERSVRHELSWPYATRSIFKSNVAEARRIAPQIRLLECRLPEQIDAGEELPVRLRVDAPDDAQATVALFMENHRSLDVRTVRLGRGEHWLKLPTKTEWAPSVRVVAVHLDPSLPPGESERECKDSCLLRPRERLLTLDVQTDKASYRPGERCTAVVRVKNHRGEPTQRVRISLSAVDEAIYGVREDQTPDLLKFFHQYHVPYLCRGEFDCKPPATTAWRYVLGPRYAWGRPREWLTLQGRGSREAMVGRYGGTKHSERWNPTYLRQDFRTTAFWTGDLVTDSEGVARVTFEWPDGITGWRFTARGVTADTRVGEVRASARTLLPLQAELALPRGFRDGDAIDLPVVLHNNSGELRKVTGATIVDGAARLFDERELAAGSNARLTIPLSARGGKAIVIRATVNDADAKDADAIERTLKPLPRGERVVRRRSGRLDRAATFDADLGAAPLSGGIELVVRREPGPAAIIDSALAELIQYPYGCVEQTMSRFMPAVVAAKAMQDAGIKSAASARLPETIAAGLARLSHFQHRDGGWGWWQHDATNDFMTAYVVEGLARCRAAGHAVPDEMFDDAIDALSRSLWSNELAGHPPQSIGAGDLRLYALHALAVAHETAPDRFRQRSKSLKVALNGLAEGDGAVLASRVNELLVADSYRLLGDSATAAKRLENVASRTAIRPAADAQGGLGRDGDSDDVVVLAGVIELGARLKPDDDRWRDMAAALMARRRGAGWGDTLATASAVRALSAVASSLESGEDIPAIVRVDGREAGRLTAEAQHRVAIRLDKPGRVTIEPVAPGSRDWYSAEWSGRVEHAPETGAKPAAILRTVVKPREAAAPSEPNAAGEVTLPRGKAIEVELVVNASVPLRHTRFTWPRPCGVEIVQAPSAGDDEYYMRSRDETVPLFSAIEQRDDATHFFIEHWPAGEHRVKLTVRAEVAGVIQAPRLELEPMYGDAIATKAAGARVWRVVEDE